MMQKVCTLLLCTVAKLVLDRSQDSANVLWIFSEYPWWEIFLPPEQESEGNGVGLLVPTAVPLPTLNSRVGKYVCVREKQNTSVGRPVISQTRPGLLRF